MPRSDGSPLRLYVGCIAAFFLCAFYWEYSVIARMHGPAAASARVDAVEQLEERMNAAAEAKLHAQSEALRAQLERSEAASGVIHQLQAELRAAQGERAASGT